jgi:hypothetical protein
VAHTQPEALSFICQPIEKPQLWACSLTLSLVL